MGNREMQSRRGGWRCVQIVCKEMAENGIFCIKGTVGTGRAWGSVSEAPAQRCARGTAARPGRGAPAHIVGESGGAALPQGPSDLWEGAVGRGTGAPREPHASADSAGGEHACGCPVRTTTRCS